MFTTFTRDRAGFAGDWHGNTGWALHCLDVFKSHDIYTIYQVGDFGVWGGNDGASYLRKINTRLNMNNQDLIVVPGNHENYDMLDKFPINEDGFMQRPDLDRIQFAPRGHVWHHNSARFAAMGGAFSIDKNMRTEGRSWWPQEAITPEDVEALKRNLDKRLWLSVDVFLSHDIPAGVDVGHKAFGLPAELEYEANRQRVLLRHAVDYARPRTLVHGHWHKRIRQILIGDSHTDDSYTTQIYGLDMDVTQDNMIVADVAPFIGLYNVQVITGEPE
jgi:hypothetical protein